MSKNKGKGKVPGIVNSNNEAFNMKYMGGVLRMLDSRVALTKEEYSFATRILAKLLRSKSLKARVVGAAMRAKLEMFSDGALMGNKIVYARRGTVKPRNPDRNKRVRDLSKMAAALFNEVTGSSTGRPTSPKKNTKSPKANGSKRAKSKSPKSSNSKRNTNKSSSSPNSATIRMVNSWFA